MDLTGARDARHASHLTVPRAAPALDPNVAIAITSGKREPALAIDSSGRLRGGITDADGTHDPPGIGLADRFEALWLCEVIARGLGRWSHLVLARRVEPCLEFSQALHARRAQRLVKNVQNTALLVAALDETASCPLAHKPRGLRAGPIPVSTRARRATPWARVIYFHSLGELRDRTFENQFFWASGLNLLVAAIGLVARLDDARRQNHAAVVVGRDPDRSG